MKLNFNKELLSGVKEEDHVLTKYLLFSIAEDINLNEIRDESRDKVHRIIQILDKNGVITLDYTSAEKNCRYVLTAPLYLYTEPITDVFVDKVRRLFSYNNIDRTGHMGEKETVKNALNKFRANHPFVTNEDILEMTTQYIDQCQRTDSFIAYSFNFINKILPGMVDDYYEETGETGEPEEHPDSL